MTEEYNFERDLLARCRNYKMDKVVRILDDGSVAVTTPYGAEIVQYLIFEHAQGGDVRNYLTATKRLDLAWKLRSLHHVSTGLFQMHRREMAHQDLKPSNILIFDGGKVSKLGDLGRASQKGLNPPHDNFKISGDPSYAPPELLYGQIEPDWNARRVGCDCYHLGSIVVFLFMDTSVTPALIAKMLPAHHPRRWSGTYSQVLPYVRDAFDQLCKQFEHHIDPRLRGELPTLVRQLCEPDPKLRGHPKDRASVGSAYSLERYVSLLNQLAFKAENGLLL